MRFSITTNRITYLLTTLVAWPLLAEAQQPRGENISEPVYRVARETPAKPVSATAAARPATGDAAFFDLTKQPGEHPLAPAKRMAQRIRDHIKATVSDYTCKFEKVERIDGDLSPINKMDMRVLHKPFGIHLVFRTPKTGQECLYVEGKNANKMLARGHGWRARFGVLHLDPLGDRAMDGQKYPITMAGILNLTEKMIELADKDMKYGECEVKNYPNAKLHERPTVMIEIIHPVPRREFTFHKARIYVDRELKLPVRYEAYDWKKDAKGNPMLIEYYGYQEFKLNNGFSAANFAETDPAVFK